MSKVYSNKTYSNKTFINKSFSNKVYGYDTDAQSYFNLLNPQPSVAYKLAINSLIAQLKSDGNWTPLDRLWITATEFQQNARISIANPTSTALEEINAPGWTTGQGYTGNIGAGAYIDTHFNAATQAVQFTKNGCCVFVYSRTNSTGFRVDLGAMTGINFIHTDILDTATYTGLLNDNGVGATSAPNTSSIGFFHAQRTNATNIDLYKNGIFQASETGGTTNIPNMNLYMLARNTSGVADRFSDRQLSIVGAGGILNASSFYTAIQMFATSIGFNI